MAKIADGNIVGELKVEVKATLTVDEDTGKQEKSDLILKL